MTAPLPSGLLLKNGSHGPALDGPCCLVEAEVVYVLKRGRKADSDPTICPVIQRMATGLNDSWPASPEGDRERTAALAPFLGRLSGTVSTPQVEQARSLLALDWLIRVYTPAWLRLVPGLVADALAAAGRVDSVESAAAVAGVVRAAEVKARAAWDAARSAAWDAARDAAWDAARSALAPTAAELRTSALDLLDRMIEVSA